MKRTTVTLSDKSFGELEFSALAFSHGLSMPLSYIEGDKPEPMFSATNPVFHDISFTKRVDVHTPKMNLMCATGKAIDRIKINIFHSIDGDAYSNDESGAPLNNYEILLEKCLLTSISASSSSDHLIESITFVFNGIMWAYTTSENEADTTKWSRLQVVTGNN
jgi:type VI secretion system Hcp family effector